MRAAASALVLVFVLGLAVSARVAAGAAGRADSPQSTRDRVYSKEQAARGAELYVKHCERCHTPEKVPAGKKPGPPVQGAKFFEVWQDRPLGELFDSILNTMPSDGSAILTPDQTLDTVAYILQLNGLPDGALPLKYDAAMKSVTIVK